MLLFRVIRKVYEVSINYLIFKNQRVEINFSTLYKVKGLPFITNYGKLSISNNVYLNSRFSANPIGGQRQSSIYVAHGAFFKIGENCGISNSSFYCKQSIVIGKDVLIGGNCMFYDTDFHSLSLSQRIAIQDDDIVSKPILIGDGVFIGAHSIILKGVTIGENSIIGAGSVVSKSVPSNQIWAGNPIRFIKNIN